MRLKCIDFIANFDLKLIYNVEMKEFSTLLGEISANIECIKNNVFSVCNNRFSENNTLLRKEFMNDEGGHY